MAARFITIGDTVPYTPNADVAAGAVVILNDLIGISKVPIPADTLGALHIEGVFNLPKKDSLVINQGDQVYWDDANQEITKTEEDGQAIGKARVAAASSATSVDVRLIP